MNIKTFVFLDSETTGLPAYEHNKTKITELCLISAQVEHISLGIIPRVQNKITLCFNPQKRIQPTAENITGLYNDELANESSFNDNSADLLIHFLERLKKPICFIAHNGFKFDYPILRNHIELAGKKLPDDILCADSLKAFRELLQKNNEAETATQKTIAKSPTNNDVEDLIDEWDDVLFDAVLKIENSLSKTPTKNSGSKQMSNETTPPTKKQCNVPAAPKHHRIKNSGSNTQSIGTAQRRLDFDGNSPKRSFKLSSVYEELVQKSASNAHQAEEDVKMLLECVVHLGDVFIEYTNKNAIPFNQIPKMEPGKKIGFLA